MSANMYTSTSLLLLVAILNIYIATPSSAFRCVIQHIRRSPTQRSINAFARAGDTDELYSQTLKTTERSVNRITLLGRVGNDPEIREFGNNDRMASFNLATSESWRDKRTGDVRVRTEWHRVCVFDTTLCDIVDKYLKKGRRVYLEGTLQSRKWVSSDGNERTITEVVLPRFKGELVLLESPLDGRTQDKYTVRPSSLDDDEQQQQFKGKPSSGGGLYERANASN